MPASETDSNVQRSRLSRNSGIVPRVYSPSPSQGPLRQGEILSGVKELRAVTAVTDESTEVPIDVKTHPLALVLTQDCDLDLDFEARFGAEDTPTHKLLPNVLFCELWLAKHLRGDHVLNSTVWRRVEQNNDERYHFLPRARSEDDALGEGFTDDLAIDFGNSGFVVGERGFGPATALDTVDAPILKPSAFGRGWDLGACVNGGVEGRAGDAPLPPKWLITMGLRQKNRFNECKACGCEPASNHMSGFGFSATDSDSGRRAHGSHERARSARKGRKKHVSVLPRPNRSPWIVVEQNHNGIGKLMVPAFQIYANMNVINDL